MDIDWNKHAEVIKARKPTTNAKNYVQELVEPYWRKLKGSDGDAVFWMWVNRYDKCHTHAELVKLMQWCTDNNLHIKQATKALSTCVKKKGG